MQRPYVWLVLSLLLCTPTSGFGQVSQGPLNRILSGYIREEGSDHLITEARLELQNALGSPIASAYSDRNGAYEFDDIGAGDCYVSVQHEGYVPVREFVRPDRSGHIYKDIFLRVSASAAASQSANPVSQHELSIPQKARQSFAKGVELVVQKSDYRGAVAQFARAISQYPSYYEAYAAMGLSQYKMGDAVAAEVALRKSVALSEEKYPQAMIDLASMLNTRNRFPEAEPLLRKVVALDASSWRGQYELAVSLAGEKRYADALASASAARALKPENPQIYLLLYTLHIRTDNFSAALADTEAYLKLSPDGALSDRVQKLHDQIQKAKPTDGKDPANSSPETPAAPPAQDVSNAPPAAPKELGPSSTIPGRADEMVPPVAADIPCSLPQVLDGAARRAEELLNSLQKFDAAERVEHYRYNAAGLPGNPDVRSFDYVVTINHDKQGGFDMQEYRNGTIVQPEQFPSGIVTTNLVLHGLIFHPSLAPGFQFTCEGLGEWNGHPTWQVHFDEQPNQVNTLRTYVVGGLYYPVLLTGRAWIDAENYQVLRLESDLEKPVPKIQLRREHIVIQFASVQFRTRNQRLWLPQTADLNVEWGGHRFYRRHTFSKFQLFSTDSVQQVNTPKESFCFTNTSNLLITGVLNATPVSGKAAKPAPLTLAIPAKGTVCKSVGSGKDVDLPIEFLAHTTFAHDGPEGSVEGDAYQLNADALEIIPNRIVSPSPNH